jgi:hypothetical protein
MTNPGKPSIDALAAGQIDVVDIGALERIAQLYSQLDPVPENLVDRIQFGLTLDALHAEIAELQRSADFVGVRSEGALEAQTVTFTSASFTTMVTITSTSAETVRIDGWVVPGNGVVVELRTVGETFSTEADDDGRFVFETVRRGMAQFVLRPPAAGGHAPVLTPSVEL